MSDHYDITPCPANYSIDRVADRVMDELLGICRGVLADGDVNQDEAKFLLEWLGKNRMASDNVLMPALYSRSRISFRTESWTMMNVGTCSPLSSTPRARTGFSTT